MLEWEQFRQEVGGPGWAVALGLLSPHKLERNPWWVALRVSSLLAATSFTQRSLSTWTSVAGALWF